jgi:alpha/beta superfamily hydrolase
MIAGPAGRLEALLEEPEDREPCEAALVCHPHPQHGGTMHNKVVYRVARGLRKAGAVVLRFNYRGVNLSDGEYAHGEGELADARAALAWLKQSYPALPYTLAGFSFGSKIVLRLACGTAGVKRVIAVGLPTAYRNHLALGDCTVPKIIIQSTNDEYGPMEELESLFETLPEPRRLIRVESANHFFRGGLDRLEEVVKQVTMAEC